MKVTPFFTRKFYLCELKTIIGFIHGMLIPLIETENKLI